MLLPDGVEAELLLLMLLMFWFIGSLALKATRPGSESWLWFGLDDDVVAEVPSRKI